MQIRDWPEFPLQSCFLFGCAFVAEPLAVWNGIQGWIEALEVVWDFALIDISSSSPFGHYEPMNVVNPRAVNSTYLFTLYRILVRLLTTAQAQCRRVNLGISFQLRELFCRSRQEERKKWASGDAIDQLGFRTRKRERPHSMTSTLARGMI